MGKAPMPTFTVEISVGGCDFDEVARRLIVAAEHVRECGVRCNRVWGGAGTHGHVQITTRDVRREQYEAELSAWFTEQRRPAQPADGGTHGAETTGGAEE